MNTSRFRKEKDAHRTEILDNNSLVDNAENKIDPTASARRFANEGLLHLLPK